MTRIGLVLSHFRIASTNHVGRQAAVDGDLNKTSDIEVMLGAFDPEPS